MLIGKGLDFWKTMPTSRRRRMVSREGEVTSTPSMRMEPPVTRASGIRSFIRLIQRSSVDFPHPEGPMNAVTLFLGTFMVTLNRDCLLP